MNVLANKPNSDSVRATQECLDTMHLVWKHCDERVPNEVKTTIRKKREVVEETDGEVKSREKKASRGGGIPLTLDIPVPLGFTLDITQPWMSLCLGIQTFVKSSLKSQLNPNDSE